MEIIFTELFSFLSSSHAYPSKYDTLSIHMGPVLRILSSTNQPVICTLACKRNEVMSAFLFFIQRPLINPLVYGVNMFYSITQEFFFFCSSN